MTSNQNTPNNLVSFSGPTEIWDYLTETLEPLAPGVSEKALLISINRDKDVVEGIITLVGRGIESSQEWTRDGGGAFTKDLGFLVLADNVVDLTDDNLESKFKEELSKIGLTFIHGERNKDYIRVRVDGLFKKK